MTWSDKGDNTECDKCDDGIALTDVEGHYIGICRECRNKEYRAGTRKRISEAQARAEDGHRDGGNY